MSKNIILCCDGTSNEFAAANTNVVKLYSALVQDVNRQVSYYHPGLGTMAPPGALTTIGKSWTKTAGLAMGFGLLSDIRDAFAFLMNTFVEGDAVYIFGFSRGAYTARSLASVLHMCGLIRRGNEPLVPYAIDLVERTHKIKANNKASAHEIFDLAARFKTTFSYECKPHFVGVWDTVSSVGWFVRPLALPYTACNPDIAIGRHAIAIDERRGFFPPNLWWPNLTDPARSGPKDLKQVWFPGSHSDVGGGYPEQESQQSKYALEWMLVEAQAAGLLLDDRLADLVLGNVPGAPFAKPSVDRPLHESLTFGWKLTEWVPKPYFDRATSKESLRMNLGRRRNIPDRALVHESAYLRGSEYYTSRLPASAVRVEHQPFRRN